MDGMGMAESWDRIGLRMVGWVSLQVRSGQRLGGNELRNELSTSIIFCPLTLGLALVVVSKWSFIKPSTRR
jgi:hypothetical protein